MEPQGYDKWKREGKRDLASHEHFQMRTFREEWSGGDYKGVEDYAAGVAEARSGFPLSRDDLASSFTENAEAARKLFRFPPPNLPPTCTHFFSFPFKTWDKQSLLLSGASVHVLGVLAFLPL